MKILSKLINWLSKAGTYRVIADPHSFEHPAYIVQVRGALWWHNVKTFVSDDAEYAIMCAYELLETLEESIEPKQGQHP